jgi:hypothetical protein
MNSLRNGFLMAENPTFEIVIQEFERLMAKKYPFKQIVIIVADKIQHIYTVEDGFENGIMEIRVGPDYRPSLVSWLWDTREGLPPGTQAPRPLCGHDSRTDPLRQAFNGRTGVRYGHYKRGYC